MTVLVLERTAPGLRGDLSRWMMEVAAGVFVGRLSRLVRDQLWERIAEQAVADGASALLLWQTNTAQGFDVRAANPRGRYVEEFDGVWLARRPPLPDAEPDP